MSTPKKKKSDEQQKIHVMLVSEDIGLLDRTCKSLAKKLIESGASLYGPEPFPRDPETNQYSRVFDIINPNPKILVQCSQFNVPNGIKIELKTVV